MNEPAPSDLLANADTRRPADAWHLRQGPFRAARALELAASPTHRRETGEGTDRREYSARLVTAGRIRTADGSPGRILIPAEAIAAAVAAGQFDGKATFVDHAGCGGGGGWEGPSLRNLAGVTLSATYNEADQSADATIRLYDNPAGEIVRTLFDQVLADTEAGRPIPDVGLSLVFYPRFEEDRREGGDLVLAEFRHIESVDFVFAPAADGRIKDALTALCAPEDVTGSITLPGPTQRERSLPTMPEELSTPAGAGPARPDTAMEESANDWLAALSQMATAALIDNSGLPAAARAFLRSQAYDSPEQVQAAIEAQRQALADSHALDVVQVGPTPPRSSGISLGPTGLEQVTAALEALIAGRTPANGIRPLTGIRELYLLLSGDYELTGRFQADRIQFANVTSSTMAGLVANALNKVVVNLFMQYPAWWQPIVIEQDFATLQQVKWITLGGVGELPTVAEGAAYTELTWDDQTETATFVKKGGYLGLTLEAIDKDDTGRLSAAPRALAQAAWLTLGKLVSGVFTDNSGVGPTMSDSQALFHANHANLGSTALSFTSWAATRTLMMKQTELNSSERLGFLMAPKFLVVPIDLETTALEILASPMDYTYALSNGVAGPESPFAQGDSYMARQAAARSRVVVVPLWTDTNNWAAVADPNLYPSLAIGYRYGRTPEVFSVASPTAGLMFSNDTLPVKVRFFVAVGPTDWRGLYKHNVA